MRYLLAILATLALAQCVTPDDHRFRVGESPRALVIIGVAEAPSNTSASYTMLWRRLDSNGQFSAYDSHTIFEPQTNVRNSPRVRGTPGEFAVAELDPGVYSLDSVFGVIRADQVNYIANGVVLGPDRPTFEVRAGEAIYLGIWEMDIEESTRAVTRMWRLDDADMRAAVRAANPVIGNVELRETSKREVACTPHRFSTMTQRQVC